MCVVFPPYLIKKKLHTLETFKIGTDALCSHAFLRQFLSQLKLTTYTHKGNSFIDY